MAMVRSLRLQPNRLIAIWVEGYTWKMSRQNAVGRGKIYEEILTLATAAENCLPTLSFSKEEADFGIQAVFLYAEYMHRNYIDSADQRYTFLDGKETVRGYSDELEILVKAYLVAHSLEDPIGQDDFMDAITEVYEEKKKAGYFWTPKDGLITKAYEKTSAGSPLRSVLIKTYLLAGKAPVQINNIPFDFLQELDDTLKTRLTPHGSAKEQLFKSTCNNMAKYSSRHGFQGCRNLPFSTSCQHHQHTSEDKAACETRKRKRAEENDTARKKSA